MLYQWHVICLFLVMPAYFSASQKLCQLPCITQQKDDARSHQVLKQTDQYKKVTIDHALIVHESDTYTTDMTAQNKNDFFQTDEEFTANVKLHMQENWPSIQVYKKYVADRKLRNSIVCKGIDGRNSEKMYAEEKRALQDSYNKEYSNLVASQAKKTDDLVRNCTYYQEKTFILGFFLAGALSYIAFDWMQKNHQNQCSC